MRKDRMPPELIVFEHTVCFLIAQVCFCERRPVLGTTHWAFSYYLYTARSSTFLRRLSFSQAQRNF